MDTIPTIAGTLSGTESGRMCIDHRFHKYDFCSENILAPGALKNMIVFPFPVLALWNGVRSLNQTNISLTGNNIFMFFLENMRATKKIM
jgi:hypothetical protein